MIKNIFVDKTNFFAFKQMLDSVKEDESNIIIVPDKFSLSAEQLFLEKRVVTFSTRIFSLTKFASEVLKEKLDGKKLIDKNISIMIISSVIKENRQNFRHYKNIKNVSEFSIDVYKFISQLESSSVQDFNDNIPQKLKDKIFDLNLIYEKYRKIRKDYLIDAGKKYDLFIKEIGGSDLVKNNNFFFGMFNSLTNQEKKIVKEIAKFSKSVSFSATKSKNKINNNDILEFYSKIDKSEKFDKNAKIIEKNSLNRCNNFVVSSFFESKNKKCEIENDEIKIFEAKDIEEEVDNLVYEIRKDIFVDNLRFKNLAVCVNGLDRYEKIINEKFKKANFSFFVDSSESLINTSFARFVISFFDVLEDFEPENILKIVKSGYLNIDEKVVFNYENFVKRYNICNVFFSDEFLKNDEYYEDFVFVRDFVATKIYSFKSECEKIDKTSVFFEKLHKILEEFSVFEKLQEKIDKLKDDDAMEYKRISQVESKICDCFDDVSLFCENFDLNSIKFFVKLCFENVVISLPCSSCDAIFVGDSLKSIFSSYEKLYVIGLDSSFPNVVRDDALLVDDELKLLEKNEEIEPKSTKTNKINYYKAFENLLCSSKNLVLSYFVKNKSGINYPSIFVKNYLSHFTKNLSPIKILKIDSEVLDCLPFDDILNVLSLKFGEKNDFIKSFYLLKPSKTKDVVERFVKDRTSWNFEKVDDKIDNGLINIKNYSSTSVEDYFACPRKFFYKDVLKISKPKICEFNPLVVGNVVHECLKRFAKVLKLKQNNIKTQEICKETQEICKETQEICKETKEISKEAKEKIIFDVLNTNELNFLRQNKTNEQLFENLISEILRIFDFVENLQKTSEFALTKAEFKFEKIFDNFLVKGFVDRIDETENEFVVIDYKTGNTKIEYSDIVFGKKVQLLLYAKILEQVLSKKCVGVFYLTISDDYSTKKQNNIFYNGIMIDCDSIKQKLMGENEKYFDLKEKYLLTDAQFEKLKNYVFGKVLCAIKNIQSEKFKETPMEFDGKVCCDYCDYKEICLKTIPNKLEFDDEMIKEILDG